MAYDSFGNLTTIVDPTARAIATSFDATYRIFPISVTNGAGEVETTQWDPVCAAPIQHTDMAGQVTTKQSDALCRPTLTAGPLGMFEAKSYLEFGTIGSQRMRTETPSASPEDGTGNDYSLMYIDGLGRTYRTRKKGPSVTQDIVVETTYDARGQVASTTAPYYAEATSYATSFTYDALGRALATTYADGRSTSWSYGVWVSSLADEHSPPHVTTTRLDAAGREVAKERHLGGQTLTTQLTYDPMGRLVGVTDAAGSNWSWTYDWLGRTISRQAPDSGNWTFE